MENRVAHRSSEPQMFRGDNRLCQALPACVAMRQEVLPKSPGDKGCRQLGMESGFFSPRPSLLHSCMTLHLEVVQDAECLALNNRHESFHLQSKKRCLYGTKKTWVQIQVPTLASGMPLANHLTIGFVNDQIGK